MKIYNEQECQKDASNYQFTLVSGEIIELNNIKNEDIDEERDGFTSFELDSAIYNQRLYEAFKNKELIQFIKKDSIHYNVGTSIEINRTFTYDCYFKIEEFRTQYERDRVPYYRISFKSV